MNANISKALRNLVAERDSYTCVLCTQPYSDVHHYIPRGRGGRNIPYNLVCLCRAHHAALHGDYALLTEVLARKLALDPHAVLETSEDFDLRLVEYICDCYAAEPEFWDYWHAAILDAFG